MIVFCSVLIAIIILSSGCGANYINAQVGIGNQFDYDDSNFYGSLSFHRANTFEYGSLTYGAFGYLGNYREVGVSTYLSSEWIGRFSNSRHACTMSLANIPASNAS